MCRCCRRSWPRPTPSSWPVSSSPRETRRCSRRCSGGFFVSRTQRLLWSSWVDKNSRFGGGDRSRRLGRVRRDRPGRSRADTTTIRAGITIRAGTIRARTQPKTTIDADGTYAVGTDIQPGVYSSAGPVGDGACYWKRVNGTNIVDNAMSKKSQIVQIDADRYGVHDERVPAVAADRRPRAGPEALVICSANWPNWRRSSPATPGRPPPPSNP